MGRYVSIAPEPRKRKEQSRKKTLDTTVQQSHNTGNTHKERCDQRNTKPSPEGDYFSDVSECQVCTPAMFSKWRIGVASKARHSIQEIQSYLEDLERQVLNLGTRYRQKCRNADATSDHFLKTSRKGDTVHAV